MYMPTIQLCTPFELMFGRKPLLSIEFDIEDVDPEDNNSPEDDDEVILALAEVLVAAKETILKAQEKQKLVGVKPAYKQTFSNINFNQGELIFSVHFFDLCVTDCLFWFEVIFGMVVTMVFI